MTSEIRPPIPMEIRRRVLVEAGHRCAIHTCKNPDVDLHHITPWAQCREHNYENLIALCPNCHRRAERGEIDRKSLRIYKARLISAFKFEELEVLVSENLYSNSVIKGNDIEDWVTSTIKEVNVDKNYDIELEFPIFQNDNSHKELQKLNSIIKDSMTEEYNEFRQYVINEPKVVSPIGYFLNSAFTVAIRRTNLVSIQFTMSSDTGGSHGSYWTKVLNYYLDPMKEIGISSLFNNPDEALNKISNFCIEHLLTPKGRHSSEDWVKEGTSPTNENYKKFNLTPEGILISFDSYQVGPYVEGPSEVLVPYSILLENLDDRFLDLL